MSDWIQVLRLRIVFMAAVLSAIGFRINSIDSFPLLIPTFITVAGSATMAHNDWRDRFHDAKKGKSFAKRNSRTLAVFVSFLWIATFCLALAMFAIDAQFGVLSLALILLGLTYSEVRRVPLLSGAFVALSATFPVMYSMTVVSSEPIWFLSIATFSFIWGREILKDIDDQHVDSGYKTTIPVLVGSKRSNVVVGMIYLVALGFIIRISLYTLIIIPLIAAAVSNLLMNKDHKPVKKFGDIVMVLTLVILFVFGS